MNLFDDIGCLDFTRPGVQRENQRVFECIFLMIRVSSGRCLSFIDQSVTSYLEDLFINSSSSFSF